MPARLRFLHLAFALGLVLVAAVSVSAANAPQRAHVMTGEYVWERDGKVEHKDVIEAIFTETDKATYDVAFRFTFTDGEHTYRGTATGSLSNGELHGTVESPDKEHSYRFDGTVTNGAFHGSHAYLEDGVPESTGSLTLQ